MRDVTIQPWSQSAAAIAKLRVDIWKPLATPGNRGTAIDELREPLDTDPRSVHVVCYQQDQLIGAGRLTLDYLPRSILQRTGITDVKGQSFLSRLVVAENHRRLGIATRLQAARVEYAMAHNQTDIWAEATAGSVNILAAQGFEVAARYFEEEAIFVRLDIAIMRKRLMTSEERRRPYDDQRDQACDGWTA